MTDVDFHSFDQQPVGQYTEVQDITAYGTTTSETITTDYGTFTVTKPKPSFWKFWDRPESGFVTLGTQEERAILKAQITFNNQQELQALLRDSELLRTTLELMNAIDLENLGTKDLDALQALGAIYDNPSTSEVLKECIRKNGLIELQNNQDLLEKVFNLMNMVNPSHLTEEDVDTMKQLNEITNAPTTPLTLQKTIVKKAYEIAREGSALAAEYNFGIPQEIIKSLHSEGCYILTTIKGDKKDFINQSQIYGMTSLDDIQSHGNFIYYEALLEKNPARPAPNQLIILNTVTNPPLQEKDIDQLLGELVAVGKKLKSCTEEQFTSLQCNFEAIQNELERRRPILEYCQIVSRVLNTFEAPRWDRHYSNKTVGGMQTITRGPLLLKEINKQLPRFQTVLQEAKKRITGNAEPTDAQKKKMDTELTDVQKKALLRSNNL